MNIDNKETVNERICEYRKLAGFTQEQAANFLSMKRNTYARMEKYGNPPPDVLKKLSELYRVSVAALLYGEGALLDEGKKPSTLVLNQPQSNDVLPLSFLETNIIRVIRVLPKDDSQKIIDYINEVYKDSKNKMK